MSVGFIGIRMFDPNKPDQRRREALHPPTNTCDPGRVGWGRRRDQKRLDARIKGWANLKGSDAYHKPGSLRK